MISIFGKDSAAQGYTGPGTTWDDNESNCGMDHAPGAGSITKPVDLQSTTVLWLPQP